MYIHEEVKNTVIKSYEFKSVIGEGVSSKVYKAYDNKRKCNFAIKVIPKLYLTSHPKLY
jgi:serine/threonine protein kinase